MLPWTFDTLIDSIKRRGVIPDAQMTYLLDDFKAMINEELVAYALPILHSYREDYYVENVEVDYTAPDKLIDNANAFRIPEYCLAGSLRDVQALSPGGSAYSVPRLMLDDVPNLVTLGWYFYGDYIVFKFDSARQGPAPEGLKMAYHVRPNLVAMEGECWKIVNRGAQPTDFEVTSTAPSANVPIQVDIIHGKSGFDVMYRNLTCTITDIPGGIQATFPAAVAAEVKAGDWICPTGYSVFPMLPSELHPMLAQRIAVKFLEQQGEEEQLKSAVANMLDIEKKVGMLVCPRVEGKPKKIVNRVGLWRRWRW